LNCSVIITEGGKGGEREKEGPTSGEGRVTRCLNRLKGEKAETGETSSKLPRGKGLKTEK